MNDDRKRPSLADQHWRAQLRTRLAGDLSSDLADAVRDGNDWRFDILLKLGVEPSGLDPAVRLAVEGGRDGMFFALRAEQERTGAYANLNEYASLAARTNNVRILSHMIEEKGVKVDIYNGELLREAAHAGSLAATNYLLSKGADPMEQNAAAVRNAAEKGHVHILESLFANGADIKAAGPEAMRTAADYDRPAVVEFLLQAGTPTGSCLQAMLAAARAGHIDVLRAMLANGMSPVHGDSAALREAVSSDQFAAADFLVKAGADVDSDNGAALRHAVVFRDKAAVKWLLDNGASTAFPHDRETPLMRAAWSGDEDVVKLLLAAGADPAAHRLGAIRVARERRERPAARLVFAALRENLAREKKEKLAEFAAAFGNDYSMEDLRAKKGASGQCGLLVAAQTGAFDKIVQKAAGVLVPDDLFHPDDGIDTVMSELKRHKCLSQFFDQRLWEGRGAEFLAAHALLPENLQKRINPHGTVARINQREVQKKMRNSVPPPPKL